MGMVLLCVCMITCIGVSIWLWYLLCLWMPTLIDTGMVMDRYSILNVITLDVSLTTYVGYGYALWLLWVLVFVLVLYLVVFLSAIFWSSYDYGSMSDAVVCASMYMLLYVLQLCMVLVDLSLVTPLKVFLLIALLCLVGFYMPSMYPLVYSMLFLSWIHGFFSMSVWCLLMYSVLSFTVLTESW